MEVKIGVGQGNRELVLEIDQSPEQLEAAIMKAVGSDSAEFLTLVDDKNRRFLIPANMIAFVEFSNSGTRRVGF